MWALSRRRVPRASSKRSAPHGRRSAGCPARSAVTHNSDALNLTLSAPSLFSSGSRTGPMNSLCTVSTVVLRPAAAMPLAANGPPPAMSQVVISIISVRRPTSFVFPETMRSMNSGTPNGRRSLCATGSSSPRGGCSRRPTVSELTGCRRGSSTPRLACTLASRASRAVAPPRARAYGLASMPRSTCWCSAAESRRPCGLRARGGATALDARLACTTRQPECA